MIWLLTFLGFGSIIYKVIKNKENMKKEYMLIGVGGMNGQIWNLIGK